MFARVSEYRYLTLRVGVILHNKLSDEGSIVVLVECARVWQPFSGQEMTLIHLGTQKSLKRTFI